VAEKVGVSRRADSADSGEVHACELGEVLVLGADEFYSCGEESFVEGTGLGRWLWVCGCHRG